MSTPPIVFITGTSSGIGETLAHAYAAQGAQLVLIARRAELLATLQQTIAQRYPSAPPARYWAADVCDANAMRHVAQACINEVGCPDIVIANAGVSVGTVFSDPADLETFKTTMDTNWFGLLCTLQPFVAPMQARGHGTMAGIASVAGVRGLPGSAAYSGSKAAVIKTLESLRNELKPSGIKVVTIAPGYVEVARTAKYAYKRPFVMPVERFAEQAIAAIARGDRYRVLPWQMRWVARLLTILPAGVYDKVAGKAPTKGK